MTKGALSFDFSDVKIPTGPTASALPVNVPLYATVDDIKLENFNGQDKFVFEQTVYTGNGEEAVPFKTFIGPRHGWLLAQYLAAVDQDFRSLSGTGLTAEALKTVLAGQPVTVQLKESTYQDRMTGADRTSKQITYVRKFEADPE